MSLLVNVLEYTFLVVFVSHATWSVLTLKFKILVFKNLYIQLQLNVDHFVLVRESKILFMTL